MKNNTKLSFVAKLHMLAKQLYMGDFSMTINSPYYEEIDNVSIIHINGEIGKKVKGIAGMADVDEISKALNIAAIADTQYCILCVDSPGGTDTGIVELAKEIEEFSEIKPIFTFTDTMAASAAYWISSATNGIFMTPSAEVGSIGVYAKVLDYSENLKMQGINVQVFQAGAMKTMGHGERPLTDDESNYIQADIDKQWQKFKLAINTNRGGVDDQYMEGQLVGSDDAIKANLADGIVSNIDELISQLAN